MNRSVKLVPEWFPLNYIPVIRFKLQLWKFYFHLRIHKIRSINVRMLWLALMKIRGIRKSVLIKIWLIRNILRKFKSFLIARSKSVKVSITVSSSLKLLLSSSAYSSSDNKVKVLLVKSFNSALFLSNLVQLFSSEFFLNVHFVRLFHDLVNLTLKICNVPLKHLSTPS